jgi:hypothetical protein
MALKVTKVEVWAAGMDDKAGELAARLAPLAAAGADLTMALARRCPDWPGKGVVFVTPLQGAKQLKAAKAAGFRRTRMVCLKVEGPDKPGLAARIADAVGRAGVNLRGLTGSGLGGKSLIYVSVDTPSAAAKAAAVIKKL